MIFGLGWSLLSACTPKVTHVPVNKTEASKTITIQGGTFTMGNGYASDNPPVEVTVKNLEVQVYEVSVILFQEFVRKTGYRTQAEIKGGSYVFLPGNTPDSLSIPGAPWWKFVRGAYWMQPRGPEMTVEEDILYKPVSHIAYEDACAYCEWLNMRLPTEAEWEYLAYVNQSESTFNRWEGLFPQENTGADGYLNTAPVGSFTSGKAGLHDMQGNVWEWCADYYHAGWYTLAHDYPMAQRAKGPSKSYDPENPYAESRVIRGGSFLCAENYCSGYNTQTRMRSGLENTFEHIGFRCVKEVK